MLCTGNEVDQQNELFEGIVIRLRGWLSITVICNATLHYGEKVQQQTKTFHPPAVHQWPNSSCRSCRAQDIAAKQNELNPSFLWTHQSLWRIPPLIHNSLVDGLKKCRHFLFVQVRVNFQVGDMSRVWKEEQFSFPASPLLLLHHTIHITPGNLPVLLGRQEEGGPRVVVMVLDERPAPRHLTV